ncbi:MAG: T9SS type A sorting domain-containing protein [Flavobacteriaceae bacterium]
MLDFSVYPIPTQNSLNIKSKTEITKIEIYSKLGQLLLKETASNEVDISNLSQGLYFVKVEDVNGDFGVKKIIKN